MKKLLYCFALFAVTSIVCLIVAYGITRYSVRQEQAVPNTVIETETVNDVDDRAAMKPGAGKANTGKRFSGRRILSCVGVRLSPGILQRPQHHLPLYHIPVTDPERRGRS